MPLRQQVLVAAILAAVIATIFMPRTAQPLDYHQMADERTVAGIPNALNVLSNLPFAFVGLIGLASLRTGGHGFADSRDRWPYSALFAGVFLTAIGSSYYHLAPDNARLVWDRLPMTVGFMGLLAALVADRVDRHVGRAVLAPLLLGGVASVVYWYWTEVTGGGDLRPYFFVQFGSLLIVALILALYPSPWSDTRYILAALVVYVLAKVFEVADAPIFAMGQIVSGHTLKHLVAAARVWFLVLMVKSRPVPARARSGV